MNFSKFPLVACFCFYKLFHMFGSNYWRENNALVFSLVGYRSYCEGQEVHLLLTDASAVKTGSESLNKNMYKLGVREREKG